MVGVSKKGKRIQGFETNLSEQHLFEINLSEKNLIV
jgi:predicted HTH transcriptional regulator